MSSWVYLFSQFTPEALLFQSLLIFALITGYTAFWVLKKRRLGSTQESVPANVVKNYLNLLIQDAEEIRSQLFGLLQTSGVQAIRTSETKTALPTGVALNPGAQGTTSGAPLGPEAAAKLVALEAKLSEQTAAVQGLLADKKKLESELNAAKQSVQAGGNAGSNAPNQAQLKELQDKIKNLESKLAEYSIIEDDLANLKRLQQENAQLKAALQKQGGTVPEPQPTQAEAAPTPTPAAAPPTTPEAPPPAAVAAGPAPTPTTSPEPVPPTTPAADPVTAPPASFEKLVDQVEKSLESSPLVATPPVAEPIAQSNTGVGATTTPSLKPAEPSAAISVPNLDTAPEKSDADLVAEFEKMLKP